MLSAANSQIKTISLWLIVVSVLLNVNTLSNKFVMDDQGLIVDNPLTEEGVSAIPEIWKNGYRATQTRADHEFYRPLPRTFHALMWQMTQGQPAASHALNVIMYALVCWLLFRWLLSLQISVPVAGTTAFIFMVHPLHSEIVANCKGLDDLLMLAGVLMAALYDHDKGLKAGIISACAFLLALCSKENAVVWTILIPLIGFIHRPQSFTELWLRFAKYALLTSGFLLVRHTIIGTHIPTVSPELNALTGIEDSVVRILTAITIIGYYFRLLLLPWPLVCDGSIAYFSESTFSDPGFILSCLSLITSCGLCIWLLIRRRTEATGLLLILISLLPFANLFFMTGTNYSERLLLVSTIGSALLLASFVSQRFKGFSIDVCFPLGARLPTGSWILLSLLLVYAVLTMSRNMDWKSNVILYGHDRSQAPEVARLHSYYASAIAASYYNQPVSRQLIIEAQDAYKESIRISTTFHEAIESLADLYMQSGDHDSAKKYYLEAIRIKPTAAYLNNYGHFLFQQSHLDSAGEWFRKSLQTDSTFAPAWNNLGNWYGLEAKELMRTWQSDRIISTHYKMAASFAHATQCFRRAIRLNPDFPEPYKYLIMTLKFLNRTEEANRYQSQMNKLNKKLKKRNPAKWFVAKEG